MCTMYWAQLLQACSHRNRAQKRAGSRAAPTPVINHALKSRFTPHHVPEAVSSQPYMLCCSSDKRRPIRHTTSSNIAITQRNFFSMDNKTSPISLLTLPGEIQNAIICYLGPLGSQLLRGTCRYFRRIIPALSSYELLLAESDKHAVERNAYFCSYCVSLRHGRHFAYRMKTRNRRRGEDGARNRFCIDCGLQPPRGLYGYTAGAVVRMEKGVFVKCRSCGGFKHQESPRESLYRKVCNVFCRECWMSSREAESMRSIEDHRREMRTKQAQREQRSRAGRETRSGPEERLQQPGPLSWMSTTYSTSFGWYQRTGYQPYHESSGDREGSLWGEDWTRSRGGLNLESLSLGELDYEPLSLAELDLEPLSIYWDPYI